MFTEIIKEGSLAFPHFFLLFNYPNGWNPSEWVRVFQHRAVSSWTHWTAQPGCSPVLTPPSGEPLAREHEVSHKPGDGQPAPVFLLRDSQPFHHLATFISSTSRQVSPPRQTDTRWDGTYVDARTDLQPLDVQHSVLWAWDGARLQQPCSRTHAASGEVTHFTHTWRCGR